VTRRAWGLVLALSIVVFAAAVMAGRAVGPPDPEHAFTETQPGEPSAPVTWEPCVPIAYQVHTPRALGEEKEALAFVEEAVDHVSAITGLRFRRQPLGQPFDVAISWASADEVDELAGKVAGVTRATVKRYAGRLWFASGQIVLDVEVFDRIGLGEEGRAILLHELGHLVGLDHVDSRAELMYRTTTGRLDYGRGDREGLVLLGKGTRSCS
jgi:hypothetical protein